MGKLSDVLIKGMTGLSQKELDRLRKQGEVERVRHGRHRKLAAEAAANIDAANRQLDSAKRKIKDRADRMDEKPVFGRLASIPTVSDLSRMPVYGVVMPMAHGKSTLCQAEGWVDCDSLVAPTMKQRLMPGILTALADGCEYEEAMEDLASLMAKGLEILAPSKPTIVLSHNFTLLRKCNIPCLAILTLEGTAFEKNLRLRGDVEQAAARISKACLESSEHAQQPLIVAADNESVRRILYQICDTVCVDTGAPRDYFDVPSLPEGVGYSRSYNLSELARMHDEGQVNTAVFNYQINQQGLKSYHGCGFTMNDWASVAASLVDTTPLHDPAIPSLGRWPLNLAALGKQFDMSEDLDGQMLITAHGGEDEAFTTGLLLHWKLYGVNNDTTGRLRLLYYVRRQKWDTVMRKVRQGVLASGTLMGEPITLLERDILLSLHMMSCTTAQSLIAKWRDEHMGYPAARPGRRLAENYSSILPQLIIQLPDADEMYRQQAWDQLLDSDLVNVAECVEGYTGKRPLQRKHVISYQLGARLLANWDGEQGALRIAREAMKQVATNWFRVGRIRDEWFDFIGHVLDDTCKEDDELSQMVVSMVATASCQGLSGASWGARVAEAVQTIVVVGWCGLQTGQKVVLQKFDGMVRPVVLGNSEDKYVRAIMQLGAPKYINSCGAPDSILALIAELVDWSRSGVGLVLEMVNAGTWLGDLSRKGKLGLLSNWALKRETKGVNRETLQFILDRFSREWVGRRFGPGLCRDLGSLCSLSRHDSGLGSGTQVYRGAAVQDRDKRTWNGRSRIVLEGEARYRPNSVNLEACRRVMSPEVHKRSWSSTTLSISGALVSCFLAGGSRRDAEAACRSIEALRDVRPWALQHLEGGRASVFHGSPMRQDELSDNIDSMLSALAGLGS